MDIPEIQRAPADDSVASAGDPGEFFCPECGQSLDFARHPESPDKRRTREPLVFLLFGLCLVVVFGIRAWNIHTQLPNLDQEIAVLRLWAVPGFLPQPSNPPMVVSDTMREVLTEQLAVQRAFQGDLTGLGLGLFTVVVGAVSWLHERSLLLDGRQKRIGPRGVPYSDRSQVGGSPWDLAGLVALTLVRMVLLLFVTVVGVQLIRGTPLSLQIVDQALTRIVDMILAVAVLVS